MSLRGRRDIFTAISITAMKHHGTLDLHRAIVKSCDTYFYTVGNKTGIDAIAEYGSMAGYGKKTGIDLPGEAEGIMPSPKWKLKSQREKWYAGDTISVAIGQGFVTVTPIQMAVAIGGLAEGGVWYSPHLVKTATPPEPVRRRDLSPETINAVVSGMYGVVNEGGTGGVGARFRGSTIAGRRERHRQFRWTLAKSGRWARIWPKKPAGSSGSHRATIRRSWWWRCGKRAGTDMWLLLSCAM